MLNAIAALKKYITDPTAGLPEEIFRFVTTLTPMVNVDLLVRDGDGRVLLTWRDDLGGGWHIPGGIVRLNETLADRLAKTASKELGCTAEFSESPVEVKEFIFPELAERSHFISFLYSAKLTSAPPAELHSISGKAAPGQYRWFGSAPEDLLSYHNYYRKYLNTRSLS